MKSSLLHTLVYAVVLGSVCALLLTGVHAVTRPYREANAEAEEKRSILRVLGVSFPRSASSQELLAIYARRVRSERRGGVEFHVARSDRGEEIWAVPLEGRGLWGPIEGLLALDADLRRVRGVSFYRHEETPGLGGEISERWFTDQFTKGAGVRITDASGRPGIRITKPNEAEAENEVDGISGATMTCDKVEAILNGTIERIVTEARGHGG